MFSSDPENYKLPQFTKCPSAGSSPPDEPRKGIKVSTEILRDPNRYKTAEITTVDPSFLSKRYENDYQTQKSTPMATLDILPQSGPTIAKLMFARLATLEKVRVRRTLTDIETKGLKSTDMKFKLEEVDENLDFLGQEEDGFHFGRLGMEVCGPSSELKLFIRSQEETEQAMDGFELRGLSSLRERMFDIIFINGKKERCLVGKAEYKRKKMRMYTEKKVQLYKICKNRRDSKTFELCVKDGKREKVSFGNITHLSPLIMECELEFPKKCKPEERLMLISMLMALMERMEKMEPATKNPFKMLQRKMSHLIS